MVKQKENMTYDKISWICLKDSKVLLAFSEGKEKPYFPGGQRESGENDVETLIREVKEELDVDIKVDTIHYFGTWSAQAYGKPEGAIVKSTCYMADFTGKLKPSSEVVKFVWLDYSNRDSITLVGQMILDCLFEKGLIK